MIRKKINHKTNLIGVENFDGETIEEKMRRVMLTNEPISEGADLVFQERAEGVKPEYDIRTDRWELAAEAKDKVTREKIAKRETNLKVVKEE